MAFLQYVKAYLNVFQSEHHELHDSSLHNGTSLITSGLRRGRAVNKTAPTSIPRLTKGDLKSNSASRPTESQLPLKRKEEKLHPSHDNMGVICGMNTEPYFIRRVG